MKDTIISMIHYAEQTEDYELMSYIRNLLEELTSTFNCPSNWRNIGTELAEMYNCPQANNADAKWVYEILELWDYEDN